MRIELLPGHANVFRFPAELRAPTTLELLYDLMPDVREVMNVADAFDINLPGSELRDAVDAETAEYVLNNTTAERGETRRQMLDDLLQPVLTDAIRACRIANEKRMVAEEIQVRLSLAFERADWTGELQEQLDEAVSIAAEVLIVAHVKAEEAQGTARAIGKARRGEMWTPRSAEADLAWLCEAHTA